MRTMATLLLSMSVLYACESDPEPPPDRDAQVSDEPGGGYYAHESIPVDAGIE